MKYIYIYMDLSMGMYVWLNFLKTWCQVPCSLIILRVLTTTPCSIYHDHQPILRFRTWTLVEVKLIIQSHVAGKDGDRIHAQMGLSQSPCFKARRQVRKRGRRQRETSAQGFCPLSYFWNTDATLLQAVFFNGVWGHTGR